MNKQLAPLISIIVPIYNVEQYLPKCIESIINQEYKNLEIILVDDGSPDKCGEICDTYQAKDSRIRVIHKQNGGLSSARNAGIEVAKGEYLGFVDSDDYIEPDMYQLLMDAIVNCQCSLAVCGIAYVFDDGKIVRKTKAGNDAVFDFYQSMIEMNTYRLFDMGAWSKLYKAELFRDIRFPIGKLSEDFYIMYKIFEKAQRVAFVSKPLYNYLQRKNSITRNIKINRDFEYAAKEQMEFLDANYPTMKIIGHAAYASAVLTVYDFYLKNGVHCPREVKEHFITAIRNNYDYIQQADFFSFKKKLQFSLFKNANYLYDAIFLAYRKIKRIG